MEGFGCARGGLPLDTQRVGETSPSQSRPVRGPKQGICMRTCTDRFICGTPPPRDPSQAKKPKNRGRKQKNRKKEHGLLEEEKTRSYGSERNQYLLVEGHQTRKKHRKTRKARNTKKRGPHEEGPQTRTTRKKREKTSNRKKRENKHTKNRVLQKKGLHHLSPRPWFLFFFFFF